MVARRCLCGKPQVIQTGPALEDGTPFPTLWWLCCKTLVAGVGRLESCGLIREVNRRLAEEPEFRRKLELSTAHLVEVRDGETEPGPGEAPSTHPGGGPQRVKCLHAHLAHHLVTGDNPVGELVLDELLRAGIDARTGPSQPCV